MRNLSYAPLTDSFSTDTAQKILREFTAYRRSSNSAGACSEVGCTRCVSVHLEKIISAVSKQEPVRFVLPAFPGKSPNTEKVLGVLPDQAERLALNFLGHLTRRIKKYYTPGIKIILCSDGRVFSDVVGMAETDVTVYQSEIDRLIGEFELSDLSSFNLDDVYDGLDFNQMRERLMRLNGKPIEDLQARVRNGAVPGASAEDLEANRMYCGITRFLLEDATHARQTKSRTAIQKESRMKAYEVIRRSNAWSELIAEHFSDAVRLSIHPQICGSKKLGLRLIGDESWMTPWHGVAVETSRGFVLMKRTEAEAFGALLIYSPSGQPSHYKLSALEKRPIEAVV